MQLEQGDQLSAMTPALATTNCHARAEPAACSWSKATSCLPPFTLTPWHACTELLAGSWSKATSCQPPCTLSRQPAAGARRPAVIVNIPTDLLACSWSKATSCQPCTH